MKRSRDSVDQMGHLMNDDVFEKSFGFFTSSVLSGCARTGDCSRPTWFSYAGGNSSSP